MMAEKNQLTGGLLRIHKLITRAISVSVVKCDEYIKTDRIQPREQKGFKIFLATLVKIMHAHHLGEDEIVFPYLNGKVSAHYERLKKEHISMSKMLEDLEKLIENLSISEIPALRNKLDTIQRLWTPHIKAEESYFSAEILTGKLSDQEQHDLVESVSKHGAKNSGPAPLALPFVIYNLQGKDRKEILKDFPGILKYFLIPVVWRRQWKAMDPFLLN